ncbi:MAG: PQQ-dependent sugar dehydrogenase [Chitinophagaceae bacterium]|nr:PQQ-dependent sugar dehydrogenase [Chitinophagaceae bacterium]
MKCWLSILAATVITSCILSCNTGYPKDHETIETGKSLFEKNCSTCHGFTRDGIGPSLSGVSKKFTPELLHRFIRDPKTVRDSVKVMPAFTSLKNEEIEAIAAYLDVYRDSTNTGKFDSNALADPIPGKIKSSGVVLNLVPVCRFPKSSQHDEKPLTRITKLGYATGAKGSFVVDLRGMLYKLVQEKPVEYLSIRKEFPQFISEPGLGTGFGSFAFHPDFIHNGLLYTSHTEQPNSAKADFTFEDSLPHKLQWVVTEWKTANPASDHFDGTHRELLRIDMIAESHGMQELAFRPHAKKGDSDYGLLYIAVGDGGSVQLGYPFVVHGRNRIWGSVLRIDPAGRNSANRKYGVPQINPFSRDTSEKAVREVFVYGFRNPHRLTWTPNEDLLVSNIGQANIESLYRLKGGENCGWPIREGHFLFEPRGDLNLLYPLPANDSAKITYPILQFDHDEGKAITGGYLYDGNELPALKNKFVFGDIPSGRLFLADPATGVISEWNITIDKKATTLKDLCGDERVDLHFGMDESGTVYILTKADGSLYRLTSN